MPAAKEYKGAVWPIRMNTDGNLERGTRKRTIKSDIRMILKGRRYVNSANGGDRLMRPGFGSIFYNKLITAFDPDIQVPVAQTEIRTQLAPLEKESLVNIDTIAVDDPEEGHLRAAIGFSDKTESFRDSYIYETETESPTSGGGSL